MAALRPYHIFCRDCGNVHHQDACTGEIDPAWASLLESRGAQDESVGELDTEDWDLLAIDCEAGGRSLWQVEEDARAKAAADAAWAARRAA